MERKALWLCEFGENHRPEQVVLDLLKIEGVRDDSWHNDVAPHFAADLGDGREVELWFYETDPNGREDHGDSVPADQERYVIWTVEDQVRGVEKPFLTNDGKTAVSKFKAILREGR